MVDLTEQEQAAMRAAMKPVAEIMAEIGWSVRLNELTEQQVQTITGSAHHYAENWKRYARGLRRLG